jgi:hypothetical protein
MNEILQYELVLAIKCDIKLELVIEKCRDVENDPISEEKLPKINQQTFFFFVKYEDRVY